MILYQFLVKKKQKNKTKNWSEIVSDISDIQIFSDIWRGQKYLKYLRIGTYELEGLKI